MIPFKSLQFNTNKLTLDYQEFEFFINGEYVCKVVYPTPYEADIKSKNGSYWVNVKIELKNDNLYDYIKEQKLVQHSETVQVKSN